MTVQPARQADLTRPQKLEIYYYLRLNRSVEEKLVSLYRQNKVVGGLYRSLGQEAISVGTAYALEPQDFLAPMIRNLGSLLVRGYRPRDLFTQYMARATSPTGGRDLNLHFGDVARGVVAPISMLGALIPVMVGVAWAGQRLGRNLVALTYIGDGGTSTGDFHEGLNLASVWKVPFVLVAEHNQYAYSTPTNRQMAIADLAERARAYAIPAEIVDGNDVLAVYAATRRALAHARGGQGPFFLECKTMRMRGHAEHDDARYVPAELLEQWRARDPLERYLRHLTEEEGVGAEELAAIDRRVAEEIEEDARYAEESPFPDGATVTERVYTPGWQEVR
ncbi:MAG TPA: thiamine pyrophosphate-dependent dehydrogenase E1 component subunit alpha [Candidatus Nitrosotenuis sp.]|jgi:TPP-dependent pyruvate/acetoin dehydrogenase alpha subunit|nr:thiamine pyrophosphate-dependent dehydrogenase E1 component subunit alpha [Candidatus Nitrosotenuis sp.]